MHGKLRVSCVQGCVAAVLREAVDGKVEMLESRSTAPLHGAPVLMPCWVLLARLGVAKKAPSFGEVVMSGVVLSSK